MSINYHPRVMDGDGQQVLPPSLVDGGAGGGNLDNLCVRGGGGNFRNHNDQLDGIFIVYPRTIQPVSLANQPSHCLARLMAF